MLVLFSSIVCSWSHPKVVFACLVNYSWSSIYFTAGDNQTWQYKKLLTLFLVQFRIPTTILFYYYENIQDSLWEYTAYCCYKLRNVVLARAQNNGTWANRVKLFLEINTCLANWLDPLAGLFVITMFVISCTNVTLTK